MEKKRVFIVHGWGGFPKEGWFPWLKKELEKKHFEVCVPKMPNTNLPKIKSWVNYLSKKVGKVDKNTFFVGHSVGSQTILRYLEKENKKIGGAIFVAPWMQLDENTIAEEGIESVKIAKPWVETPIDFAKVRKTTKNFVAFFSDNDIYVPLENIDIFDLKLHSKIIVVKKQGHFSGCDGVTKCPVLLKELISMTKR